MATDATAANDSAVAGGADSRAAPSAKVLAREDFIREANAICREATASIDALEPPESLTDVADSVPALQDIAIRELGLLQALGEPADQAERLNPEYFSLLDRQIAMLEQLGEAAANDDIVRAQELFHEAAVVNQRARAIATDYGLSECTPSDEPPIVDVDVAPEPSTPEELFVAAADRICSGSRDVVDDLREPQTIAESVEVLTEIVDISNDELAQLRELDVPEAVAARFAELLDLRVEQIGALAALGEALESDDRDAAGQALLASSSLNAQSDQIEQELGFEVCGAEPIQEIPNQRRAPNNG